MGFWFQRRINIGKGLGINVNNAGVSTSYRGRYGSIGTRGFTLKTGIPGVRYRGSSKNALPVMLIFGIAVIGVLIVYNVVRLIVFLVSKAYYAIKRP